MNLKSEVVRITPELARSWLEQNLPTNRKLNNARVDVYAHDIREGKWDVTGDSIKFNGNGKLLDGQHRLRAVVKCNVPIHSLVVWGVETSAFRSMDRNQVRTNAQILGMAGEKNTTALSSSLRLLYCYRCGELNQYNLVKGIVTAQDLAELLEREGGIRESIRIAMPLRHLMSQGGAGFLHYILDEKDPDHARQFIEKIATGEMLQSGELIYKLRERLLRMNIVKQGRDARGSLLEKLGMCVNVWNITRSKSKSSTFTHEPQELFPDVV